MLIHTSMHYIHNVESTNIHRCHLTLLVKTLKTSLGWVLVKWRTSLEELKSTFGYNLYSALVWLTGCDCGYKPVIVGLFQYTFFSPPTICMVLFRNSSAAASWPSRCQRGLRLVGRNTTKPFFLLQNDNQCSKVFLLQWLSVVVKSLYLTIGAYMLIFFNHY